MTQLTQWCYVTVSSFCSPALNHMIIINHMPFLPCLGATCLIWVSPTPQVGQWGFLKPKIAATGWFVIRHCEIKAMSSFQTWAKCSLYLDGDCVELKFVDGVLSCRHRLHHLSLLLPEFFLQTQNSACCQDQNKPHVNTSECTYHHLFRRSVFPVLRGCFCFLTTLTFVVFEAPTCFPSHVCIPQAGPGDSGAQICTYGEFFSIKFSPRGQLVLCLRWSNTTSSPWF